MADEEKRASVCVVDVGRVDCGRNEIAAGVQNGVIGNGHCLAESSRKDLRTYKRRKHNNLLSPKIELLHEGELLTYTSAKHQDKMVKQQGDKVYSLTLVNDVENGHQLECPRNIVLGQLCKSISATGGSLCACLKNVLSNTGSSSRTADKDSVHSHGGDNKCQPHTEWSINGFHNSGEVPVDVMPNRLPSEAAYTITESCQRAFVAILTSEKFAQLSSLLMENFSGMRVDDFFDIKNISSRIQNGSYETSPVLFHSDIKQLWTKVQKVGTQMASLGNCLLEKSSSTCHEHVAGYVPEVGKYEVPSNEQNAASIVRDFSCSKCREHTDKKDCLVCNSCKEVYHIPCIQPAVNGVPSRSWNCWKCTNVGIQPPNDNCIVCKRLDANVSNNIFRTNSEENSNNSDIDENQYCCSICGSEVENNQDLKICGHAYCPHKYYHTRCLTGPQMNTHGPCWYCPSCLCLTCLLDKDDDKIVLCDGCDHAYHIYCMEPPLDTIPKGKWFCVKCSARIQKIQTARKTYEKIIQSQSKTKGKDSANVKKSGGVEMLLNAAETLETSSNKICNLRTA